MAPQLQDGGDAADVLPPLLQAGALPGEQQDKGELDDLSGLDVHREAGDMDPAQVAAPADPQAGDPGGEDEEQVEGQQQLPGAVHEELDVH